jgi:exopolysaccharide biosynthesis polyprenyl glycosylphosphotransferase
MNVNRSRTGRFLLVILDITMIHLGFLLTHWLLEAFSIFDAELVFDFIWITVISASIFVIFSLFDLYANWWRKNKKNLIISVVLAMVVFSIFTLIISISPPFPTINQSYTMISYTLSTMLIVSIRVGLWMLGKKRYGMQKVLIVGEDSITGLPLARKFFNHNKGWFHVAGFLPMANLRSLEDYVNEVDIFMISPSIDNKHKEKIINFGINYGKEVLVIPNLYELSISSADTMQVDDILIYSIQPHIFSRGQIIAKRLFDVVLSFVMLLFFSPLLTLMFILIPMTSKGPALYKQERLGLKGRPYWIYKFRSMVQDAEDRTGPVLATDKDPRITKVGAFIRAVRLDELPQLFNVLKGEMSLVGPRPEREYFIRKFKEQHSDYSFRLAVKPGITGLAQVQANYTTSVEDKLRYDLMYVRTQSLFLDIKILFQTIRVVLQREQAQGVKATSINQKQQTIQMVEQKKVFNQ